MTLATPDSFATVIPEKDPPPTRLIAKVYGAVPPLGVVELLLELPNPIVIPAKSEN